MTTAARYIICFTSTILLCLTPLDSLPASDPVYTDLFLSAKFRFRQSGDDRLGELVSFLDFSRYTPDSTLALGVFMDQEVYTKGDVYNHDRLYLYSAYLDQRLPDRNFRVRLGRQGMDRFHSLILDGASLFHGSDHWEYSVTAGVPHDPEEKAWEGPAAGVGIAHQPWRGSRMSASCLVLESQGDWYDYQVLDIRQNLSWQGAVAGLDARFRTAETRIMDLYARLSGHPRPSPSGNLQVASFSLDYYLQPDALFAGRNAVSNLFNDYTGVFGRDYGFQRISLQVQLFSLGSTFVSAGTTFKDVIETGEADLEWANFDARVFHLDVTRFGIFRDTLTLTLSGNYIHHEQNQFYDISGSAGLAVSKALDLSAGLTFTGYDFGGLMFPDTLNGQPGVYNLDDHIGARIWFAQLDYRFLNRHKLVCRAAYEESDGFRDQFRVMVGVKLALTRGREK